MDYFFVIIMFICGLVFLLLGLNMRKGINKWWFIEIKEKSKKTLKARGIPLVICGAILILLGLYEIISSIF